MQYMDLFILLDVVGESPHISEYNFSSFIVLGSTVLQTTIFVLLLSSRSVSGGFSLVDFSHCLLTQMCPIIVFLDFSR